MDITCAWLNVNRQCNLRCKWCYAANTGFSPLDDMPVSLAYQLLDFLRECGVSSVILVGGEPACYSQLLPVIRYASSLGLGTTLITNGLLLSDEKLVRSLKSAGISAIDISLKGYSPADYEASTGVNGFDKVIRSLSLVKRFDIPHIASYVISAENVDFYLDGVRELLKNETHHLHLSFEFSFPTEPGSRAPNPKRAVERMQTVIERFTASLPELDRLTNQRYTLHQTYPLCLWDLSVAESLIDNRRLMYSCQLMENNGIVFDTHGELLVCNALSGFPIGRFGKDFSSKDEFCAFLNSESVRPVFKRLGGAPDEECLRCKMRDYCKGGCVSNWFNLSFADLPRRW